MKYRYVDIDNFNLLLRGTGVKPQLLEHSLKAYDLERCVDMGAGREPSFAPTANLGDISKLIKDNFEYQRPLMRRTGGTDLAQAYITAHQTIGFGEPARSWWTCEDEPAPPTLRFRRKTASGDEWNIVVPLQPLLKGFPIRESGAMGYAHTILVGPGIPPKVYEYVGITQRDWVVRMREHLRGIANGERKKFYNAWRTMGGPTTVYHSALMRINATYEEIMVWEEEEVDRLMLEGSALNMIPGGFKGLKFLHQLGANVPRTVEGKRKAVEEFERANPQAGRPNPLMSKMWEDDAYAQKMICNTKLGRLEQEQVIRARQLGFAGVAPEDIVGEIGARNVEQVQNIIDGKTYTRIF